MDKKFIINELNLEGSFIIQPTIINDERGYFIKDYQREAFLEFGLDVVITEVFYSKSHANVLRGLHFQSTKEQAKLIRCLKGMIFDVIVDIRPYSVTYGKWQSFILSEENGLEIYVPKGFAHGFYAFQESIVSYKCSEKFISEYDSGIIWNDEDLNIEWPIENNDKIIISKKDSNLMTFKDYNNAIKEKNDE